MSISYNLLLNRGGHNLGVILGGEDVCSPIRKTPMVRQGLLLSCFLTTPAFAACDPPEVPHCVAHSDDFASEVEMQACRGHMEIYRHNAEEYATCRQVQLLDSITGLTIAAKADLAAVEVEFLQAVDSFNRRANPGN